MNNTISNYQKTAEDASNEVVQGVTRTNDEFNRKGEQVANAMNASPPISVEWYEALIQQQRMNDKIKANGSTLSESGSQIQSGFRDVMVQVGDEAGKLADVASTLADKMGE